MATAISTKDLSKAYRLGNFGTGTLSRDLERFWARVRGKQDPLLKIGEVSDRQERENREVVWSLKDLNFDIAQGDTVGVIGRNGAGKSTLLKILSRVTSPTTGTVKIRGRIASLLEVGTGFHPELTGRENTFLNGAILGMRKSEIKRKFDEIVDFAGVERYIDTPVKRYSSGMYVRLAFAVAAHLESEILIVDEVLAVGDAEFQKKCLGKMGDVSRGQGRTILFVSHNMGSVKALCANTLLLQHGQMVSFAPTEAVISTYLALNQTNGSQVATRRGNRRAELCGFYLADINEQPRTEYFMGDDIFIHLDIRFNDDIPYADIGINVKNMQDDLITHVTNLDSQCRIAGGKSEQVHYIVQLCNVWFSPNEYRLDLSMLSGNECFDALENCMTFRMYESDKIKRGNFPGHVKVYTPSLWLKAGR